MITRGADTRGLTQLYPENVYDYAAEQNVSTLTTLLAATDFGSEYRALCFWIRNMDGSNTVDLIVEPSHDGATFSVVRKQTVTAAALTQEPIEVGDPNLYSYYRISAHTLSPGFPTVSVKWGVVGWRR